MKLTKQKLEQIIKEELSKVLNEQIDEQTLIERINVADSQAYQVSNCLKIGENVIKAALAKDVSQRS